MGIAVDITNAAINACKLVVDDSVQINEVEFEAPANPNFGKSIRVYPAFLIGAARDNSTNSGYAIYNLRFSFYSQNIEKIQFSQDIESVCNNVINAIQSLGDCTVRNVKYNVNYYDLEGRVSKASIDLIIEINALTGTV